MLNYLCDTFPYSLAADHEQAADVWAGSDIERQAMVCVIFPVYLLFVASVALTVQGCPCYGRALKENEKIFSCVAEKKKKKPDPNQHHSGLSGFLSLKTISQLSVVNLEGWEKGKEAPT